jgi:hypothetical protein
MREKWLLRRSSGNEGAWGLRPLFMSPAFLGQAKSYPRFRTPSPRRLGFQDRIPTCLPRSQTEFGHEEKRRYTRTALRTLAIVRETDANRFLTGRNVDKYAWFICCIEKRRSTTALQNASEISASGMAATSLSSRSPRRSTARQATHQGQAPCLPLKVPQTVRRRHRRRACRSPD